MTDAQLRNLPARKQIEYLKGRTVVAPAPVSKTPLDRIASDPARAIKFLRGEIV